MPSTPWPIFTAASKRWLALIICTALSVACSKDSTPHAQPGNHTSERHPARLMTVNYPLLALAEAIAGDSFAVSLPALAGDPAFWQPDAHTIIAYQQADRILCNGAGYARWLSTASLPEERLVDTSASFHEALIDTQALRHSHGPGAAHDHGAKATTTWLDMRQAAAQANAIHDAMLALLPASSPAPQGNQLKQRLTAVTARLADYDRRLSAIGQRLGGAPLLYSHPVYQYLQRAYQLNGRALTWEPEQTPTPQQWQYLQTVLEQHPARLMLWEAEPLAVTRQQLEEMGIAVVVFSPVANRPDSGDFWSTMEDNISTLEAYLTAL